MKRIPVPNEQPVCNTCGETGAGTLFPLFPKSRERFGTICSKCDDAITITRAQQEAQ